MIPVVPMASVLDILLPVAVTQIVMHWATAVVTLMKCVLQVGAICSRLIILFNC